MFVFDEKMDLKSIWSAEDCPAMQALEPGPRRRIWIVYMNNFLGRLGDAVRQDLVGRLLVRGGDINAKLLELLLPGQITFLRLRHL